MSPAPAEAIGAFGDLGGSTVTTLFWSQSPNAAAEALISVAGYLERLGPPLRASAQEAKMDVRERFRTETAPDGAQWQELSYEYNQWKMKHYRHRKILSLKDPLEDAATSDSAFQVDEVGGNIFLNTSGFPPYWALHQFGSAGYVPGTLSKRAVKRLRLGDIYGEDDAPGKGANTPPRPYLGVSADAEAEIFDIFDAWFYLGTDNVKIGSHGTLQMKGPHGQFGKKVTSF